MADVWGDPVTEGKTHRVILFEPEGISVNDTPAQNSPDDVDRQGFRRNSDNERIMPLAKVTLRFAFFADSQR